MIGEPATTPDLEVHDAMRGARAGGIGTPATTLIDGLLRSLKVSQAPDRFQAEALEAARVEMDLAAIAWVPASAREETVVAGAIGRLSTESYRAIARGARPDWLPGIIVVPGGPAPDAPAGWVVAVDEARPDDDRPASIGSIATLIAAQRSNARAFNELKDMMFGVVRALTAAIDAKDPYTCGHSERVARIAVRIGEQLGLSSSRRGTLYLMGLLHDVGKIGIDDGVLKKPGPLDDAEARQIRSHVEIGVHILADLKALHHLLPGVRHHHESLDGSGYPAGLAGDAIPLEARILAVSDAFDAMSSTRPYRRALTPSRIDEIFRDGAGKQWDDRVVDALFACRADLDRIRQKGLGESLNRAVVDALRPDGGGRAEVSGARLPASPAPATRRPG